MKTRKTILILSLYVVIFLFAKNVSAQDFDTLKFLERARVYHINDLKNYRLDSVINGKQTKPSLVYFTTNIDTLKKNYCDFSTKENDISFLESNYGWSLHGKIKSFKQEQYNKEENKLDTTNKGEMLESLYFEFDTNKNITFSKHWVEAVGSTYEIFRQCPFEKNTKEVLSFYTYNDSIYQLASRKIIKYNDKGREIVLMSLYGRDTTNYGLSLTKYENDTTTDSSHTINIAGNNYDEEKYIVKTIYNSMGKPIFRIGLEDTVTYTYNHLGKITKEECTGPNYKFTSEYFYKKDKLSKIIYSKNGIKTRTEKITYGKNSRIIKSKNSSNQTYTSKEILDEKGNCLYSVNQYLFGNSIYINTIEYYE